jgi:nucleoprotein TPR
MNSTFDIYKTETDKLTMDLQAKVQNLEADRLGLVEKLAQVSRTLTETQEKMDAQVEAFNASNNIYETQIRSLKANEERALKSVAGIKSDLDRQCKSIQEVQENYEREVMAHSTSLNTLNELKQKNMRLIAEKDKLAVEKGSIETELNNSKESFEVIKSKLENQIKELEKRLADLNTQNQLLHATFEQLSASKHLVPDEDGEPGVESKTITDLREVIQFLRREKEIADTKLQLATQEAQRNLIQIQQLQKSLEESRICVEEERKRNLDISGTERQHRELLEKIEQANLLRESNITLRSHLESAHNQVSQLETKLKSTESSIEPLKSKKNINLAKVNDLESELAVRAAECQTLMEDNTRWKGRAQQILEKYERIDPVEHERLRNDVSRLSAEAKEYSERLRKAQGEFEQKIAEKEILVS